MGGIPNSLLEKYEAIPFFIFYVSSQYQDIYELNKGYVKIDFSKSFNTKTKSFTSWWTNFFTKWRVSIKNRKFDFRVKKKLYNSYNIAL